VEMGILKMGCENGRVLRGGFLCKKQGKNM
jgi:hypothetical protein